MINELDGLNEQQRAAVLATEGYVRVIAGAGSGKTKTLTHRYAYLVNKLGVSPSNILCVTFTNKAAQEMKNRVRKFIDEAGVNDFICTYHGFCVKVLREAIHKIAYPSSFIIMDEEDQKSVLREIYEELKLKQTDLTFKKVKEYITTTKYYPSDNIIKTYIKNHIDISSTVTDTEIDENENIMRTCFIRYLQKQRKGFMLDFDDLILFTVYLFQRHMDVLQKWQHRLDYIMVDESQDNSDIQWSLVNMLQGVHHNLFVVGDPDQCIYEWRGAKPDTLLAFDRMYSPCRTIILDQNYRSTPNILNVANSVIANNKNRIAKDLFTSRCAMGNAIHFHGKTEEEEGDFIAQTIIKHINNGGVASDMVILYRAAHVSRFIEQALVRHKLPYAVYGGIRFFERQEIKDVLAYLRLVDSGDDLSFKRVINQPRRKLGKVFLSTLNECAVREQTTLYEALKRHIEAKEFNKTGAVEFLQLIESARKVFKSMTISDSVQYILEKTGLIAMYRTDGDDDRVNNVKELITSIQQYERLNKNEEDLSLTRYLQDLALFTNIDYKEDNDCIKIMTIHQSKGLEFPIVFVAGMNEGTFPSHRTIRERKQRGLEEERRLAYVAYTRAENALYLTDSEGYNFETSGAKYTSRFIFEIKKQLLIRQGCQTKEMERMVQDYIDTSNRLIECSETVAEIVIGTRLTHKIFGLGEVAGIDEANRIVEIHFDNSGVTKHFSMDRIGQLLILEN